MLCSFLLTGAHRYFSRKQWKVIEISVIISTRIVSYICERNPQILKLWEKTCLPLEHQ